MKMIKKTFFQENNTNNNLQIGGGALIRAGAFKRSFTVCINIEMC